MGIVSIMMLFSGLATLFILRPALISIIDKDLYSIATSIDPILNPETLEIEYKPIGSKDERYYIAIVDGLDHVVSSNLKDNFTKDQVPVIKNIAKSVSTENPLKILTITNQHNQTWRAIYINQGSYLASTIPRHYVAIAVSLHNVNETIQHASHIFFTVSGVILILTLIATLLVTSVALAPLKIIEFTATAFASGNHKKRLKVYSQKTELGRLSLSINTMLHKIENAIADRDKIINQMKQLIADAAHELRTPLVTLKGYTELYKIGALETPKKSLRP